jgi:hypothetical protein
VAAAAAFSISVAASWTLSIVLVLSARSRSNVARSRWAAWGSCSMMALAWLRRL